MAGFFAINSNFLLAERRMPLIIYRDFVSNSMPFNAKLSD